MRKAHFILLLFIVCGFTKLYSQAISCLTPTLVFSAYTNTSNIALPNNTLTCFSNSLLMVRSSPSTDNPITKANVPCMRFTTSLTNANSTTNNSLIFAEGTNPNVLTVCGTTCANSLPNTVLYSYYVSGLTPSQTHQYTLCNVAAAANINYTVSSCYDNTPITTGIWNMAAPNSCQAFTVPANSAIGSASYAISPTVSAAAIVSNSGNGTIWYDPTLMAPGIYTVTYTFNAGSCSTSATKTLQIGNPFAGPGSAFTAPAPLCPNGPCIDLDNQLSGTAYFPGTWSGTGVSSNSFCPSTSGAGTFQITYSVGITPVCSATNSAVFYVAPQPTVSAGPTQSLTCANNPTVLVGSGGGTYSWSNGTYGNNFSTASNPTVSFPGTYTLVVSNGTCFSSPSTVQLVTNSVIPTLPSISVSNVLNCISSNSTAVISAVGSGITYTWSGPGTIVGGSTSSPTVNTGGTFNYTITSTTNGCKNSSNVAVTQNTAVPLNISSSAIINCTNNITSITGDQPSYSYNWTAPATGVINSGQFTPTINVTGTGIYTVSVTNPGNACSKTFTFIPTTNTTVTTPTLTAGAPSIITCSNPTVVINSLPNIGSGYSYTWSTVGGNIVTSVNGQSIAVTTGTVYTATITDVTNGCIGTKTISITSNTVPPSALNINPNNVVLACPAQTAILTGTAVGASSFSWNAPAGGSILSGANTATANVTSSSTGVFTLVATGANGCYATQLATVSPNTNAPTFTLSNSNPSITCSNNSPSVTVNLTSTVTIGSYVWTPTVGISGATNTSVVTFTAAGSYTAIITATNGCISTAVVPVGTATTPPAVVAGTGTAPAISCSNSVVTIAPSFTPASANYTYTWSGPGIVGSSNNSSVQANATGTYTLLITNTLTGCTSLAYTVPVTGNNSTPNLNVSSSSSIGIGCSPNTSTVNIIATSTAAVTYSWSTGATTSVINTAAAGIYTVTVTDIASNCSTTQTIAVANSSTSPAFTATPAGNLPCGSASGTVLVNAISSNTNVTYTWFGNGIASGSNTPNATINQAGIYTVTALDNVTGCSTTSTLFIGQPTVVANFSVNVASGMAPLTVDFTNNSLGANSYSWTFGNGGVSTSTNPSNVYVTSGNYTVTLVSSNGNCSDTYTLEIKVNGGLGTIPQIFTPNGDGKNDPFYIPGLDNYPKNKLQIFNRWGNIVYDAAPYKNDWDGSPNKSSMGTGKLPVGTYFYILDLGVETEEVRKGFVQLEY